MVQVVEFGDPAVTADVGHVVDATSRRLLTMGLAEGRTIVRDVPKDALVTFDEVEVPDSRLADRPLGEQRRTCPPVARS